MHPIAFLPQHISHGAGAGCWFPNKVCELADVWEQRIRDPLGRLISIERFAIVSRIALAHWGVPQWAMGQR
jgi:hypothetical protein